MKAVAGRQAPVRRVRSVARADSSPWGTPASPVPQRRSRAPLLDVPISVLFVDDDVTAANAVRRMLRGYPNITFEHCRQSIDALAQITTVKPTIVLQNLVMPEIHGLTLLKLYQADPALRDIPVVAMSSQAHDALKNDAFLLGASDYLVKMPDAVELVARIRVHSLTRVNQLQKDEANRALSESQQALLRSHQALAERVAELQAARDELARLVSTDSLTGLHSRHRWFEAAASEFLRYQRHGSPLSVIVVDLDLFKRINDTFGHEAGDGVLKQFAGVLQSALRQTDIAGRIGGEEFAILLPDTPREGVQMVARRIVERCRAVEVETPSGRVTFSCSVGAATVDADERFDDVLRRADKALYLAKESGRDRWALECAGLCAPAAAG